MTNKKLKKGKAYVVQWVDSCGTPAGWVSLEDGEYPTEVQHITSYGTLISHGEDSIVLAQSYIAGGGTIQKQAMGIVTIPIVCISRLERIF